jgi:hypothetical protein
MAWELLVFVLLAAPLLVSVVVTAGTWTLAAVGSSWIGSVTGAADVVVSGAAEAADVDESVEVTVLGVVDATCDDEVVFETGCVLVAPVVEFSAVAVAVCEGIVRPA